MRGRSTITESSGLNNNWNNKFCSFSGSTVRPAITPQAPSPCSVKQFSCASGECVHLDRRCDLQKDCADGSDEKDCGKIWIHSKSRTKIGKVWLSFDILSSSGLHHVVVDGMERMQCVLRSGLPVPAAGRAEGGSAGRGMWRSSVRQSILFPSSMSRSEKHTSHASTIRFNRSISLSSDDLCSRWSVVRVDRVVGVRRSVRRRRQTEEQVLFCSSS